MLGILCSLWESPAWDGASDGNSTRFLAVLVIATPCPLLLAIPVAIIGAISVAASRGIIIKDPSMLERIDTCRTVIFDKTGTLTYGRPTLTDVICAPGKTREQVLKMAASLEQYSKHPLAATVTSAAKREGDLAGGSHGNQRTAGRGAKRRSSMASTCRSQEEKRSWRWAEALAFQTAAAIGRDGVHSARRW